jgi:hypothetical protein
VQPHDYDQRWLPDPIPPHYYARTEMPAASGIGSGLPWGMMLAGGAVALVAVVLVGVGLRLLTGRPSASAQQLAPQRVTTPSASPSDQSTPFAVAPTDTPVPTDTPTATPTPTPTPTATPSATPTAGFVTIAQILPVRPGGTATVIALTAPRATCQIAIGYTPEQQLPPARANGAGRVTFSWQVDRQVQPGTYPVQVTCGGATGTQQLTVR